MTWRRAPRFWAERGLPARLLAPVSWLVAEAARLRQQGVEPHRAGVPVICVGNLVAGGAGKTPVALDLLKRLSAGGKKVYALTRGYGGREAGPLLVDPERHDWRAVGDEALLLARVAPTVVSRDRIEGAALAEAEGAEAIVMDDGFQNPLLHKDLNLLVVDGGAGLGNGMVMPSGPLRERPDAAFKRADAVIILGEDKTRLSGKLPRGLPLLQADLTPPPEAASQSGRRLLAFAGIGRPAKFFDSLRATGAEVVAAAGFPDHHPYRESELSLLIKKGYELDAQPITTEKDLVRIPAGYADEIECFPITLRWRDSDRLWTLLENILEK